MPDFGTHPPFASTVHFLNIFLKCLNSLLSRTWSHCDVLYQMGIPSRTKNVLNLWLFHSNRQRCEKARWIQTHASSHILQILSNCLFNQKNSGISSKEISSARSSKQTSNRKNCRLARSRHWYGKHKHVLIEKKVVE